jgi:hypothetical protein
MICVRISKCVGLRGILYLPLPRDAVPYGQARGIPLNEGLSYPQTIQRQNLIFSSSLKNSRVVDITQRVTCTPSATQQWPIIHPTTAPGTKSRNTLVPSRITQTDSTCRVVSSLAYCIVSTHTPLSGLESLRTPIPTPEAHAIITNSLRTRATDRNQRQMLWHLQLQAGSTTRSGVSGSHSIQRFCHSDMKRLVFANGQVTGALHVQ